MPRIEGIGADVPMVQVQIDPGVYNAVVESATISPSKNTPGQHTFEVDWKIIDEGANKGRTLTSYTSVEKMKGSIRRCFVSCGLNPEVYGDTEDLIGKVGKISVKQEPFNDPVTKETRMVSKFNNFELPPEIEAAERAKILAQRGQ